MDPFHVFLSVQESLELLGHRQETVPVVAFDVRHYLGVHGLVVHLLEAYQGLREYVFIALFAVFEQGFRGFRGSGVHQNLAEGRRRQLGGVGGADARGSRAHEGADGDHSVVFQEQGSQRVREGFGVGYVTPVLQFHFYDEVVAGCHRHHLDVDAAEHQQAEAYGKHAAEQTGHGMAEGQVQGLFVYALNEVEEAVLRPGNEALAFIGRIAAYVKFGKYLSGLFS